MKKIAVGIGLAIGFILGHALSVEMGIITGPTAIDRSFFQLIAVAAVIFVLYVFPEKTN